MATYKYKNGKPVEEKQEKRVGLTVNVFVKGVDEEIDEVTLGSHLGQGSLKYNEDDDEYVGLSHFRPGSKLPVRFYVDDLGATEPREDPAEGMRDVDEDFDALAKLDEKEKVDALSEAQKDELSDISLLKLLGYMLESHKHPAPTTPMEDAAIAILQHEDIPQLKQEPNTATVPGPLVDSMITLYVGEHEFTEDSNGYLAEKKPCADGRTLYQFNWTGVPVSVLDEPD